MQLGQYRTDLLAGGDAVLLEKILPPVDPSELLSKAQSNNWLGAQMVTIEQSKIAVALLCHATLLDLASRTGGPHCGFDVNQPCFFYSPLHPRVGDTLHAEVALAGYQRFDNSISLSIDGQPTPFPEFYTAWKRHYAKPGLYPVHLKVSKFDWKRDTSLVQEKTFHIRVSE